MKHIFRLFDILFTIMPWDTETLHIINNNYKVLECNNFKSAFSLKGFHTKNLKNHDFEITVDPKGPQSWPDFSFYKLLGHYKLQGCALLSRPFYRQQIFASSSAKIFRCLSQKFSSISFWGTLTYLYIVGRLCLYSFRWPGYSYSR